MEFKNFDQMSNSGGQGEEEEKSLHKSTEHEMSRHLGAPKEPDVAGGDSRRAQCGEGSWRSSWDARAWVWVGQSRMGPQRGSEFPTNDRVLVSRVSGWSSDQPNEKLVVSKK